MDNSLALKYGPFVVSAETVGPEGDPTTYAVPDGYKVIQVIYGNELGTDKTPLNAGIYTFFGVVAVPLTPPTDGSADYVIAVRGTGNIFEWIWDAHFLMRNPPIAGVPGQTEDGFTDLYLSGSSRHPR